MLPLLLHVHLLLHAHISSRHLPRQRLAHTYLGKLEKLRLKQFVAGVGALGAVCFLLLVVEMVQVGSVA